MNDFSDMQKIVLPCELPSDVVGLSETSFTIDLRRCGEQDSGYRTRNDPHNSFQRGTITDREKGVSVQCSSREVIHGVVDPESKKPATLLVYDFYFSAMKRARRIISADITFNFSSTDEEGETPHIKQISPFGKHLFMSTSQDESITEGREAKASAGYLGTNLGVTGKKERTISRTISDAATVIGTLKSNKYGTANIGARWHIEENNMEKKGVPFSLRTALFLHREDQNNFQCVVDIEVKADWRTELGRFIGSSEDEDDPILFNPNLPPTSALHDINNLGAIDLEEIFDITAYTKFNGSVK